MVDSAESSNLGVRELCGSFLRVRAIASPSVLGRFCPAGVPSRSDVLSRSSGVQLGKLYGCESCNLVSSGVCGVLP